MLQVLIIDDDPLVTDMLLALLGKAGYQADAVHSSAEGLDALQARRYDLVLCDLKMPRMNGLEFLDARRERGLKSTVIMMSAYGTLDLAVEAMKRGAYDYISKPFTQDEIVLTLRKAEERESLRARVSQLEEALARLASLEEGDRRLIGTSPVMGELKEIISKVAAFDSTVLVTGESGTGKELVARAIHASSARRERPFVAVNCGAIPPPLLESELFGHLKGAFTDAKRDKTGLVTEADGGTLLLDEIGELPLALQVALLRVIQEGEVRPVGAARSRQVDVRFIASTHRNLSDAVAEGTFREDLFYRLNVVPIQVPALRQRVDDIPLLAEHILAGLAERMGRGRVNLHPETLEVMLTYPWPGNVRELENVLERALVLADGDELTLDGLPPKMRATTSPVQVALLAEDLSVKRATQFVERELIKRALIKHGGNRTHASRELELSHRALLYKLKSYGLTDL